MNHQGHQVHQEEAKLPRGPGDQVDALAHEAIGAAIEVHRELGPGFLESIYESALAVELKLRAIPFVRQAKVPVLYKGQSIGDHRIDMLLDEQLIVELKAVDKLAPIHQAQVISYLKATGIRLALLINFNERTLKDGLKRIIL